MSCDLECGFPQYSGARFSTNHRYKSHKITKKEYIFVKYALKSKLRYFLTST
jgi:hypothetical protein